METINWSTTKKESILITKIVKRAVKKYPDLESTDTMMDITATHCNGCRLKLAQLLETDDFNFAHDIFGIVNNIDRNTGKLKNCFLPRFSN